MYFVYISKEINWNQCGGGGGGALLKPPLGACSKGNDNISKIQQGTSKSDPV